MKTILLTLLACLLSIAGVSQVAVPASPEKNYATDRSVYDDANEIAGLYAEFERQKIIAENPSRVAAATQNRIAAAKKKATDEITAAKAAMDDNMKSVAHILSYYFDDKNAIKNFNAKYGFALPEDIAPAKKDGMYGYLPSDYPQEQRVGEMGSTVAIDAIATFLANRFKKEINIAFLDKFRKQLDSLPQLGSFFPISKKILKESDPYNYPVFIGTLRQACEQDLANLKVNLPQILNSLDTNNEKLDVTVKALALMMDVRDFTGLRVAINDMAQKTGAATGLEELHKQLGLLAFSLNASTRVAGEDIEFLTTEDLSAFSEPEFARFYFALLVRQNEGYLTDAGITAAWNNASRDQALKKVVGFIRALGGLNSEISVLQEALKTRDIKQISGSLIVFITTMDKALLTAQQEGWFGAFNFGNARTVLSYAAAFHQTVIYVEAKQYGLALSQITGFVLEVTDARLTAGQKTMVKKYSGFLADMLNAKSKDELMDALDNSANPVGSYRVKRNSTFNVSFNAYAGGFYGSDMKGTGLYGFTAPIGIYAGWGNWQKKKPVLANDDGKSIGLFVPIIDVGAVASFRLQDSETDLADVSWDNVFAPGAYLTYGFGKCPVSLSVGGQMGPALRSVVADGTSVLGDKEWFWRASVVIDIPIFDFYIKQKEYKTKDTDPLLPATKSLLPGDEKAFLIDDLCALPTIAESKSEDIQRLFERFSNSSAFNWGDPNNCEDRANAVCKILTNYGFPNGKAWLFREDPGNNREKNIFRNSWAFHVAAYMVDQSGRIIIIDPALFRDSPGDLQQWAHKVVEHGKAYYILTKNKYYLHKKGPNFCGDTNWETDDITDHNSKTIRGLANPRWFINSGERRKAAYAAYKRLHDDTSLRYN